MRKVFQITIPLSKEKCFKLVNKSGSEIGNWRSTFTDKKNGLLEWKQGALTTTGASTIQAILTAQGDNETSVEVNIIKPFQLWDPARLCDRIFRKLEKACLRNLHR